MARRKHSGGNALIARTMKKGRGTGLGVDHTPWLKIYDVLSLGRSQRLRGIKTGRAHHFLSDIEVSFFTCSTGTMRPAFAHLYAVRDGKLRRMTLYVDTIMVSKALP